MPRIRTIKPEFWDSPDTARASLRARLLYIAMWNWADDWGVGSANPRQLAAFAFPNDDGFTASELPSLVKEVADCFGVVLYEVNRRPYYAIPAWDKHQRTERKARRLNPEPPPLDSAGFTNNRGTSLTVVGSSGEGTGEQGNRGRTTSPSADAEETPLIDLPDRFAEFWDAYDKKTGKKAAEQKWRLALKKPGVDADLLIQAARSYVSGLKASGKHPTFTKDPVRWLNGEHWTDEVVTRREPTGRVAGDRRPEGW